MSAGTPRSAILRAEISHADSSEVTCALEMTEESVFIVTEALPPIGELVRLQLSFPRAVHPVLVSGRVTQVRMSDGPGSPPGFVAEFDLDSEETRQKVADVARRLRRPSGMAPANRVISVLLVEDNQLIRDMFAYAVKRYFAQRAGNVVLIQAPDVTSAWKVLGGENLVDMVLVDHFLPDETGAALIAKLRANANLRRLPIVAMSVGGADVQRAMLEAGADLFLHKPIVLKDLFCTLEFLMDTDRSDRGAA